MNAARLLAAVVTAVLSLNVAHAGNRELADQGDNYAGDGQQWGLLPFTTPDPLTGSIPFALNFGTGAVSGRTFFIDPHGRVNFTTDISGTTNTGDFVNMMFNTTPSTPGQFAPRINIANGAGLIDPSVVDKTLAPQFGDKTKGLQAYRMWFTQVCPTNDPGCSPLDFQAVFLRLTDDAFVLEFNYGSNLFDALDPTSEFLGGFKIGSNALTFASSFGFTSAGPDFCFNNGVAANFSTISSCVGTTAVGVPEPDVASLLLLGGFGLALGLRARRRPTAVA